MQEPNVLGREHADQLPILREPDLNKVLLKRQNVLVAPRSESSRLPFPRDSPVVARSPSILVDEEGKVCVAEQELRRCTFYVDWLDVVATNHKVQ